MPVHDWTCVSAGIFHDFHHAWICELQRALNGGVLPDEFYALVEQLRGRIPPVLRLQQSSDSHENDVDDLPPVEGTLALAAPPKVRFTATTEMQYYVEKQNSVVIRHSSGDQVVALVEVVSPGNKSSRYALRKFVEKAAETLFHGYHLLILDLLPPGPRDPQGIHGAIWEEIEDDTYRAPVDMPLTLAAYASGQAAKQAYVEPIAVGDALPDMPLFLTADACVHIPLEKTYQAAWNAVPKRWQRVLDGV
jgi:hypothetical protein